MITEFDDISDQICDVCGSEDGDGCPFCRPCSGCYAPGSEECDWCPDHDYCAYEGDIG